MSGRHRPEASSPSSSPTSSLSSLSAWSARTWTLDMARRVSPANKALWTVVGWMAGLIVFFPILWMVITSFKTELEAYSVPPSFLFFDWTTEQYEAVLEQRDYPKFALNSIILAGGATLLGLIIAIPAAWSMAFSPTRRTKDVLLWMLSTKMMPAVGVLVPMYLIF